MVARLAAERIQVGHQVAAHPVGVDELNDCRFFGDLGELRGQPAPSRRGRAPI